MKNKNKIRKNEIQKLVIDGFVKMKEIEVGDIISFSNNAKTVVIETSETNFGEDIEVVIANTTDEIPENTSFEIIKIDAGILYGKKIKRKFKIWERQ